MRIVIDTARCNGRGECVQVSPRVFAMDDGGVARVIDHDPDDAIWDRVLAAIRACPRNAITVDHAAENDPT